MNDREDNNLSSIAPLKARKKVSFLKKCATSDVEEDIYLDDHLDDIKNGRWSLVAAEADTKSREKKPGQRSEYETYKSNEVPAVTCHGTFFDRSDAGLKERNFMAVMDLDHVQNIVEVIAKLKNDPYTRHIYRSLGGDGICLWVEVDQGQAHAIAHEGLREYYSNKYKLICDENAKDLSRLRAVSYDPNLWTNENSVVWKTMGTWKPLKKTKLLTDNNHRAQISSFIGERLAKGDTADEVETLIAAAHIDPASCMSDPEAVRALILDQQKRYHEGREGKGVETVQYCGFWTNNFRSTEVQLSTGLLLEVLISFGYSVLDGDYVQVRDGIIYKVDKTDLYASVIDLASFQEVTFSVKDIKITIDRTALKSNAQKTLRGMVSLFAIPKFNREIMRDTAKQVFLHFRNQSMVITPERREIFKRDGSKCIFEKQVIPHEFHEPDGEPSAFVQFIQNIAGDNLEAFSSALGYALRNFNGSDGMRALWLCDETFNAGKNNGRSGKSLFAKAIGRMRNMDECSGKDLDEKSVFKFQNVNRDTQVYDIEDVRPGFDFSILFTTCTEGMEYQAKHRDRVKLSMGETPKIVITSNRPPKMEDGSSMMGRLLILPVKSYYVQFAPKGGVKNVHGHTFFDDWDGAEWNRFFAFMAACVESYLKHGLVECDMTEVRKNRLKEVATTLVNDGQTTDDFIEWIHELKPVGSINPEELRAKWIEHAADDSVTAMTFGKLIKCYLDVEGIGFMKKRTGRGDERKTIYFTN